MPVCCDVQRIMKRFEMWALHMALVRQSGPTSIFEIFWCRASAQVRRRSLWDLMVHWTNAHTKAQMTAEQKQTVLGNDVGDMLAEKRAEGDGAKFAERVARDERETREKIYAAFKYAACFHEEDSRV